MSTEGQANQRPLLYNERGALVPLVGQGDARRF